MNVLKTFRFGDQQNKNLLDIVVSEYINPDYGMYVWPCAPVLAQYIWKHRASIKDKKILEIGAGTALPGVLAAKCGADVTLSDSCRYLVCQENCKQTCVANNLGDIPVIGITWGEFDPVLLQLGHVDIILASDCFYETKDFEDVLVTVSFILNRNKECQFWCSYQERSADRSIEYLMKKWGLKCKNIPLENFNANVLSIGNSNLPGNHTVLMFIITVDDSES